MTCVGDLGILSISGKDIVINQQLHAFIPSPKINNIFLMFALSFQKNYMLKMASNTTVPYMNKSICNSVPVILPELELQIKFSKTYKKVTNQLEKLELSDDISKMMFYSLSQTSFSGC
jgi:type I restriction enzyme S subunit